MFVLKKNGEYMRYLGGRLIETSNDDIVYRDTGFYIVTGALWTPDIDDAHVFKERHVSFNRVVDNFMECVRAKHGYEIELVNVRLMEVD